MKYVKGNSKSECCVSLNLLTSGAIVIGKNFSAAYQFCFLLWHFQESFTDLRAGEEYNRKEKDVVSNYAVRAWVHHLEKFF